MVRETNFNFERIPIPINYRVREFTKRLEIKFKNDDDIRKFWSAVLKELRKKIGINMVHLDSLILVDRHT